MQTRFNSLVVVFAFLLRKVRALAAASRHVFNALHAEHCAVHAKSIGYYFALSTALITVSVSHTSDLL
jgi:hypothetical protein